MTLVVLDTNVISEAMRGAAASPQVIAWLRSLAATPITTVVNRAEILAGIALLALAGVERTCVPLPSRRSTAWGCACPSRR